MKALCKHSLTVTAILALAGAACSQPAVVQQAPAGNGASIASHYQRGRLVRRGDLNPIGLESFSKQEEAPIAAKDNRQLNLPGSEAQY